MPPAQYEVIARRYRPQKFEQVVGQESIAQTLRGGIIQGRLAHAYLFAGPRGVGKTSMARIFAKAINCPRAADRSGPRETWAVPCDECETCRAVHSGQDIDVIEMDGASHRGIEDIRGIVEGVNRPATRSPYKVYLIDEVHMLTREAFNALLKTLEEPPPHVKFIFATTEAHKIPDTVLSRCQRFDFQPIREDGIVRRLSQICEAESRQVEQGVLERVARYSRGGLRDSQTLLDQLMTFSSDVLTIEELDQLTGRVPTASVEALVAGLVRRDAAGVFDGVRGAFARGADPTVLLEQVVEAYHAALVAAVEAEAESSGAGVEGRSSSGDEAAEPPSVDVLVGGLQILLDTATRLRASAYPEIAVEIALLKLSRLEDPRALDRALAELREIEARAVSGEGGAGRGAPVGGAGGAGSGAAGPARSAGPPRAGGPAPEGRPSPSWSAGGGRPVPPGARSATPGPPRGEGGAPVVADAASAPGRWAGGASPSAPPRESASTGVEPAAVGTTTLEEAGPPQPVGTPCDRDRLLRLWEQILIETRRVQPSIASFVGGARLDLDSAGDQDGITLRFADDFHLRQMRAKSRLEAFEGVVREVTGAPWKVRVDRELASGPGAAPAPVAGAPAGASGRAPPRAAAEAGERGAVAGSAGVPGGGPPLAENEVVRKAAEIFRGRLV